MRRIPLSSARAVMWAGWAISETTDAALTPYVASAGIGFAAVHGKV